MIFLLTKYFRFKDNVSQRALLALANAPLQN